MSYVANTDAQRQEMLTEVGVSSVQELFDQIPSELRAQSFDLPEGLSELEVRSRLEKLAAKNATGLISFLGGGCYDHFIPAAVDALAGRSEFYTSYTPYQPEASQGTLQATYEYQSAICRLTDMEVSNASLYDGGTAVYEAVMMAMRVTKRVRLLIDECVNPLYRDMVRTHLRSLQVDVVEIPHTEGHLNRDEMTSKLDGTVAAIVLANPNFFGCIDDYTDVMAQAHASGSLAVMSLYPLSLGLLKTPAEMGADIVVGECQSLGLPLSFGGPYLGLLATRKKYVRQMPGRVVGATRDAQGRRGFTLTLQTREQHIRREKATSNICSNEALCALRALIYLTLLGKQGLPQVARLCLDKAAYAAEKLTALKDVGLAFEKPFFNEFVLMLPRSADEVSRALVEKGFAGGIPLGRFYPELENGLLVAFTEKRSKEEIDSFANALEAVL